MNLFCWHTHVEVSSHKLSDEFPHASGACSGAKMPCPVQLLKFLGIGWWRMKKGRQESECRKLRLGGASSPAVRKMLAPRRLKSVETPLPNNLLICLISGAFSSWGLEYLVYAAQFRCSVFLGLDFFSHTYVTDIQLLLFATHNSWWIYLNIMMQKWIFNEKIFLFSLELSLSVLLTTGTLACMEMHVCHFT